MSSYFLPHLTVTQLLSISEFFWLTLVRTFTILIVRPYGHTDSRRSVWIEAKTQSFSSFAELNAWLDQRCRTLWAKLPHPDYTGVTIADVLEQEPIYLMPMPTPCHKEVNPQYISCFQVIIPHEILLF